MPIGGEMERGRARLAYGLLLAVTLGGCFDPTGLGNDKEAMVAVGKAAREIDRRLPANCTRVYVAGDWGTIDEPLWNRDDKRCTPFSHRGILVFRRANDRWTLVTVKRSGYGHFGSCAVDHVPRDISKRFTLC